MPQTQQLRLALLLFVGSGLCLSGLDGVGKLVLSESGLLLLVWSRYVGHLLLSIPIAYAFAGPRFFVSARLGLQLVRSLLMALTTLLFFAAVRWLPLAEASALAFTAPIWVALLSWKVLGESVAKSDKWVAAIGFSGVLLIVRPGTDVFHPAALLVMAMALANAVYQLLTRKLTQDSAFTTFFFSPLVGAVVSSVLLAYQGFPETIPVQSAALLSATGILGGLGHLLIILSFYRAPPASLTPFVYLQMIWAIALGWLLFGQLPDAIALTGMAVIVLAGLWLILHRRRVTRTAAAVKTAREGS
ncbi:MAG: DMT family transporter [Burkholderiaceae bacterium]